MYTVYSMNHGTEQVGHIFKVYTEYCFFCLLLFYYWALELIPLYKFLGRN
jgi:hypothetical protein